jgi:5-methylthioadenosine/S-adenosylhomocysteine deaminase
MIIIADKIISFPGHKVLNKGAIVLNKNVIHAIGPATTMQNRYSQHRIIICRDSVVLPGIVNTHAHLELPPLFQKIKTDDYAQWVLNLLKAKSTLTLQDYRMAAARNLRSLLQTGTTTVAEICTHGASPAILRNSGIRSVIFHEILSMHPGQMVSRLLPKSMRSSALVRHGLSPHSPHTISEKALSLLRRLALKRALPVCMHVAESREELELLRGASSGIDRLYQAAGWQREWAPRADSSFAYLARIGMLDARFLAVHAVHTDSRDRALIKRTRAAVVHCPRSNSGMGVGTMPLRRFLRAHIPVGLGTDSLASVPTLSMWDEMRSALRLHRGSGVTAREIFQLATIGGARVLGLDSEIGSLEPGKKADVIAVPLPRRNSGDLYSDLLRETKSCTMTMVNGKVLYRENAVLRR